ncbi:hypothetical protein CHL78_006350 [Romboutsia weinsteinii]|uniref:Uncharacterized protein n=1 Tax=Romboutsia weinsteinii TaxID=2020949 RepID=A0A371J6H4_9FIRM|nr:hypothetical protein CHL78_006350 [Romboutsia weinsteinii]
MISRECFNQASESIMKYARPLEKSVYQKYFKDGPEEDIILELKKYQNEDGGFGNGIESDFILPQSSPMATSVGLRLLSNLERSKEVNDIIKLAIDYLEKTYNTYRNGWFSVPKEVNDFPHAPWWSYDDKIEMTVIDKSWGNPTAEIIGYLYKYKDYVKTLDVELLVEYAISYIENKNHFNSEHELYCYLKLFNELPNNLKDRLEKKLAIAIDQVIVYDEKKWLKYVPTPLDFIKKTDSHRFEIIESKIDSNLDFIIRELKLNERLIPPWGNVFYKEGLDNAYNEWTGVLTLEALIILDRFNRISL